MLVIFHEGKLAEIFLCRIHALVKKKENKTAERKSYLALRRFEVFLYFLEWEKETMKGSLNMAV